ncbi:MAG: MNIO family bufferin maturase [Caldimonas sp.]
MAALGAGLGLKAEHFAEASACRAEGLWFEVHAENYLVAGGARLRGLEAVRRDHPLSLHGVSLSLAGAEAPDAAALAQLAALVRRVEPALVSEHLAWSRRGGVYLPDLLPFPRSDEALAVVSAHVARVQDALGRPIALENPSHYLALDGHEWDEIGFLAEVVRRTGCKLLLDINNVYVSARNLGFSAERYVDAFPAAHVAEIHLAGHRADARLGERLLIDSHDAPVAAPVWALFQRFVDHAGARPTLIERDAELPPFAELLAERDIAQARLGSGAAAAVAA